MFIINILSNLNSKNGQNFFLSKENQYQIIIRRIYAYIVGRRIKSLVSMEKLRSTKGKMYSFRGVRKTEY